MKGTLKMGQKDDSIKTSSFEKDCSLKRDIYSKYLSPNIYKAVFVTNKSNKSNLTALTCSQIKTFST